ncbi:deleted in malignant brain tumors 1 protein-like [Chiloscyllium plagiosum]|uniref:deleted in malignant brain tumors 1 protein-like n=1 Tax=Chiloscyllium plagiosum TaxID=36176 RepID=UPI001CB8320D|nr:deleted in malignant brain tumors 1 protein-like [Chiloscyllium plagiosum]
MVIPVSAIGSSKQPSSQDTTVGPVNDKELSESRLVGLERTCAGQLLVRYRGRWGSVCSSLWDSTAGEVVCRQIGCNAYHATLPIPLSQETGPILLEKVHCNGTESSLSECSFSASDQQSCETGTVVGFFCKGNSQFGAGYVPMLNFGLHCKGTEEDPWKCELKPLAHKNCSAEKEAAGVVCSEHRELRLVGGTDGCSGRLEIQKGNTWGTVCDSHWDSQDARVVCASLKCGEVIAVLREAQFGEGSGPVWQDVYECQGNETILWDCPILQSKQMNCTHRNDVSIICSGQRGPRLVGGNDTCSGRLEILMDDTWGTVCDTDWDLQDAAVVCNQLACGAALAAPGGAFFGEGNGSIWNDKYECIGNEMQLRDCTVSSWGQHRCSHSNDAVVICTSRYWQMRLANGETICDGRVEVYDGGTWGRVTDTQWNFNDADVVCRQLNCGSAINIYNHSKFGKGTGPSLINNVKCNGNEPFLWNCSFTQMEELSIADGVGVVCSDHIQIRLVDGGSRCAGRVELYSNGTWGTVCDDSWDLEDAQVVCQHLKCGQALNATISSWFDPGVGPIWLDNVKCRVNDSILWECLAGSWGEIDCNHKEDAGVICSGEMAMRLQDGANHCQGRVEVFYNGTWGTICADSFGIKEAEVICKQLGCGSAQSVEGAVTFGSGSGQIWLDDVSCRLHDTLLWQCPSSPWGKHNCNHQEDVGIICSELRHRTTVREELKYFSVGHGERFVMIPGTGMMPLSSADS